MISYWKFGVCSFVITAAVFTVFATAARQHSCICPGHLFRCQSKTSRDCTCFPKHWVCDGDIDCPGGTDEERCASPTCGSEQYTCANGMCIEKAWRCDADNDCGDDSDELDCPQRNCTAEEYKCKNGNCIHKRWQCDDDDDCGDGSDENCPIRSCTADEVACRDGTCISKSWWCDKDVDCSDGSDEESCHPNVAATCSPEQFQCDDGKKCISREYVCDGDNDCGDWSEERVCEKRPACQSGEFQCENGMCINGAWKCDGESDCDDKTDELDCPITVCKDDEFRCQSGRCIRKNWRCDGEDDCADKSDEAHCPQLEELVGCGPHQFKCHNNVCIGSNKVCNGRDECGDRSDENPHMCANALASCSVNNGGCAQKCFDGDYGVQCSCRSGYSLAANAKDCQDFNECEIDGACSQSCTNTPGSYICSCIRGYQLRNDRRSCKALGGEAYLIFANRVDIRKVLPNRAEYTSILEGLENAIAVDFHHEKNLVYWSDVTLDKIKRANINGSNVDEIVGTGLESPGGIAVDWIHDKLFWTDSGTSRIEVANLDGSQRRVIIWKDLMKPRAIAADPLEGYIYWTDWGKTPRIERAYMNGEGREIIVRKSLLWPNGLTLDYTSKRIYWADAKHHVIECAHLNGTRRKTILSHGLPHPFAITIFEDDLFWTDWKTKSIYKANKFDGHGVEAVKNKLHYPMDIHTLHPQRQPAGENVCGLNNGGCSHLCLPAGKTYTCACPTGFKLHDGKICAKNLNNFLVFTRLKDIRRISFDTSDRTDVVIPLKALSGAVALDWDSATDMLYWSDVTTNTISRSHWDGERQEVVLNSSLESPAGLAIDWVGRKLYWTDANTDRIEVANLDGSMRTVLIYENLDKPRDIIVDPIAGFMYWTDWGKQPKIERASMDGTKRTILIQTNLTWPNGLAIDYELSRLYWADGGMKTIEFSDLDGRNRQTLISDELPHPFGLTLYDNKIYWTDWESKCVHRADKLLGHAREIVRCDLDSLMDIRMFHRYRQSVPNACQIDNGGCSHLCLLASQPRGHRCACPTGVRLKEDGRHCEIGMKNFLIFARRTDIRAISLDMDYYADVVLPVGELRNAIALDIDPYEGKVYWADSVQDGIFRSNLDGSQVEVVIKDGLDTTDGIAIDPIGKYIYWTDTMKKRIEVSTYNGHSRKVLFWEHLDSPRAIALFYEEGLMFWVDWGAEPRIERANMDGSARKSIITEKLGWPNGLTIDKIAKRIIWVDARKESIEMSDFSGHKRHVLIAKAPHPYGITVAGEYIYWTDWVTKKIERANKNDGSDVKTIRSNLIRLMDIRAVQTNRVRTSIKRRCPTGKKSSCSHFCLARPNGYTCACPTGLLLKPDRRTCYNIPSTYLLFASRGSIRRISMDTPGNIDVHLPLPDLHNAIALDYDLKENKIYYTDVYLDVIRRANLDGTEMETIVSKGLTTADGIAVDWIARNLYWTDTGRNVIEVSRLDGSSRKTLLTHNLDQPRALALHPKKGLIYWTDWGSPPKIERAFMDGTNRKVLVHDDLGWPNGLTIDFEDKRLYWVDAQLDRIETSDMHGRNRIVLVDHINHPFGVAVWGEYVYWTDWHTRSIDRADKKSGKNHISMQGHLNGLMDIHVVSPLRQTGTNPCAVRNGGCSHLCLARPDGYTCACPNYPDPHKCTARHGSGGGGRVHDNSIDDSDYDYSSNNVDWNGKMINKVNVRGRYNDNRCSKEMRESGLCEPVDAVGELSDKVHIPYIILGVVLFSVLIVSVIGIVLWKRKCHHHHQGASVPYDNDATTLTFSNPTYAKTSSETIDLGLEKQAKKTKPWKSRLFKYHKNEESVSMLAGTEEKLNNFEVAAAATAALAKQNNVETPPPPPVRHDSKNIFVNNPSKKLHDRPTTDFNPIETPL
ncbi:low-density lipoprotein receptor-related protein 4-like [Tubulanus polymorphus]|uniref:low-density lipoprotein receptor-related protein 4-like n=1 Tax=Tubulanus polymorphus TaxID=672921 RepID=UPI003DA37006